jgi:SAM-dependent methyltransferase
MTDNELRESLEHELAQNFSGWDFSYLEGRVEYSPLPWSYTEILKKYFSNAHTCLDMGTGGGEYIDSFKYLPAQMYATEGYAPNIEIARNRLGKRNIIVKELKDDDSIPFESDFFDLVINKHESYSVSELARILKPEGYFITQQVGGMNNIDLNAKLGAAPPSYYDWTLLKTINDLRNKGFKVLEYNENIGYQRFYDTGSIAYYLKCIPWQIPDFSIDKYFGKLKIIDEYIEKHKHIDFIDHRFYVIGKK